MKAMIFAAGIGSRLKPWTDFHPKALAEVGGKPMLGRVIDKLVAAGISDIIINAHHFAPQIVEYVGSADFGARITISDESDRLLDTGGGLRKAAALFGEEPLLIHNADILTDFDIGAMARLHFTSGADVTLLVQDRDTSRKLIFNGDRMCGWTNLSTGEVRGFRHEASQLLAFGGVHIIEPSVYEALADYAPADTPFSIINFYIDRCASLQINPFMLPEGAAWFDVGKPETLAAAQLYYS